MTCRLELRRQDDTNGVVSRSTGQQYQVYSAFSWNDEATVVSKTRLACLSCQQTRHPSAFGSQAGQELTS